MSLSLYSLLSLPRLHFSSEAAEAKGCSKGAIVGSVAGHMVGHGKLGAAADAQPVITR